MSQPLGAGWAGRGAGAGRGGEQGGGGEGGGEKTGEDSFPDRENAMGVPFKGDFLGFGPLLGPSTGPCMRKGLRE